MRQFQIETVIRLFVGIIIAGCWWFAAIRLQKHWILYAIAIIATIGPVLSASMIALTQVSATGASYSMFSVLQTLLAVTNAVLYVIFAGWLVRFAQKVEL
jgi:hypothetical protein